ncbi:hypothetical protein [Pseudonocardia asaccharolytica]|uniref:Uncharacterized protein n=1 Tax=Pseudonocardia asaccharolytica DSM 44247 = NBRC 16224 TaxID=1123024 RepID=A0A511D4G1_9PSEU|nr:hypothetical protein [Pseudonocardia asaccharolytica]GEL19363.1 hypothetical protein PA7_32000 [Pseudonocardia asaccharolytica DSM 44247 = NBRC 16224]
MAREYDFDSYLAEARPTDFVLKAGDERIVIEPPDGETVVLLDEATTGRRVLELICGDQFGAVWELVRHRHSGVLNKLARDIAKHFGLDQPPPGGGRAS